MQVVLIAALAWISVSVLVVSLGAAAARGDRQPGRQLRRRPAPPIAADRAARIIRIEQAAQRRRTSA